jgi:hypothetical protein
MLRIERFTRLTDFVHFRFLSLIFLFVAFHGKTVLASVEEFLLKVDASFVIEEVQFDYFGKAELIGFQVQFHCQVIVQDSEEQFNEWDNRSSHDQVECQVSFVQPLVDDILRDYHISQLVVVILVL